MQLLTQEQCENLIFESYYQRQKQSGDDAVTRNLAPVQAFYQRASIKPSCPVISITGSKGKGSTAILIASLLHGMGKRVGLITSPGLISHRERIRLNGISISEMDFRRILTQIAPHLRAITNRLKSIEYISPNGIFVAIGMVYFHEQNVDVIVLEAGRGGRHDEASLFQNEIAVITRIDYEHTVELGGTLERIAWHKAGIIQSSSDLITGDIPQEALEIITRYHEQTSTGKHEHLGRDFTYTYTQQNDDLKVTIKTTDGQIRCQLATYAQYQAHNLALAIRAIQRLDPLSDLSQALNLMPSVRFYGRAQKLSDTPLIFLDGAIHRQAAQVLVDSLLLHSPPPRLLLTALPNTKDFRGVLDVIAPHVETIMLTQPQQGYLSYDEQALLYAQKTHPATTLMVDTDAAIQEMTKQARTQGATLWIVGTQSLMSASLRAFLGDLRELHGLIDTT